VIGRLALLALAAVACLTAAMPAQAGSAQCPDVSYVQLGGLVFAGEPVPAGVTLTPGRELGAGEINRPRGTDPCEREQVELAVFAIEGVDPGTAVLAEGVTGEGFILGGRCTGLAAGAGRWDCILAPLDHEGTSYTAVG
jgi:hypothetical protein